MPHYRRGLPQLSDKLFITDGGLETVLIYHEGYDLPCFAAFPLLETEQGRAVLRRYFSEYAALARDHRVGCILESPTWRASYDWGQLLGYDAAHLAELNRQAIALLAEVRNEYETPESPMVISGCMGSHADGYSPETFMDESEAEAYHSDQIATFLDSEVDMVAMYTMSYVEEAIGMVRVAAMADLPVAVSFTVETDGRLPSGMPLNEAILTVDKATESAPVYYMINCAHPTHFMDALQHDGAWRERIRGVRANASCKSHVELDAMESLDDGDPVVLAQEMLRLQALLPALTIMGGCCGTDIRHIRAICMEWMVKAA